LIILLIISSQSLFAIEGYPPEFVKMLNGPSTKAYIQNSSCFPVTGGVLGNGFRGQLEA
jgi:hypothetical protein